MAGYESPLRDDWLTRDAAIEAYLDFETTFGSAHARLARQAAFPLILTPELVNLIWINFSDQGDVPWIAGADFLLSRLCRPMGYGFYQVDPNAREVMLVDLVDQEADGPHRLYQLADFLLSYVARQSWLIGRPEVLRAYQWIAWSYLNPNLVVEDMTRVLQAAEVGRGGAASRENSTNQRQVAMMLELVHAPLEFNLPQEKYRDLAETADFLVAYWYPSFPSRTTPAQPSEYVNTLKEKVLQDLHQEEVTRAGGGSMETEAPAIGKDEQFLLPDDLKDALAQSMGDLGFPLEPGRLRDYSDEWHRFYKTRLKDGYLAFLYVRNRLLESATHVNDFSWVGDMFAENGAKGLFIFSDSSRVELAYDTLAKSWKKMSKFTRAEFFDHADETRLLTSDPESRKKYLTDWFRLANYTPAARFENLKEDQEKRVKLEELIRLTSIVVMVIDFSNRREVIKILNAASLDKVLPPYIVSESDSRVTVRNLLETLTSYGRLSDRPEYTALGAFLAYLLEQGNLNSDDSRFIIKLITQYNLIEDPEILKKFEQQVIGIAFKGDNRRDAIGSVESKVGRTNIFRLEMMPAGQGDCLWIEYGDPQNPKHILVDGGTPNTYPILRQRLQGLPPENRTFELLIITHADANHIGGLLLLLEHSLELARREEKNGMIFKEAWFNSYQQLQSSTQYLGPVQGEKLSSILNMLAVPVNNAFENRAVCISENGELPRFILSGGMQITLLSPTMQGLARLKQQWDEEASKAGLTPEFMVPESSQRAGESPLKEEKEAFVATGLPDIEALAKSKFQRDQDRANASSIAVLAEFDGKRILLAGDANVDVLSESIQKITQGRNRLHLDAFKLANHGSKRSLNRELLEKLDCQHYLFSTNGAFFNHPDRETVARVIKFCGRYPVLMFNYRSKNNMIWDNPLLMDKYGYSVVYPSLGQNGLVINL